MALEQQIIFFKKLKQLENFQKFANFADEEILAGSPTI